ncbi:MAG: 2-oxo acid dehydrogenase subunit E2 [Bacteroidetes bacterium]|nr:2-oxo acid dehydrogenase subunit E2 [Bacteroidota bacterium]
MATTVIMPKQGLQMTEGIILQWFRNEGDSVNKGEPLFSIETDKLTIDIDSPETGTIVKILKEEGETVPITETIAILGEPGENIDEILKNSTYSLKNSIEEKAVFRTVEPTNKSTTIEFSSGRVFATPRARMRAEENSINLDLIKGTGPEGLIIERDIVLENSAASAAATPLAKRRAELDGIDISSIRGSGPRGKIYSRDLEAIHIPLTGTRKIIAEKVRSSLDTAAQAVHRVDVDMSEVVKLRDTFKNNSTRISFNDIIMKAVAVALKSKPEINSKFCGEEIIRFSRVNIGIAVAVEQGLLIPVVKDVNKKSFLQINKEIRVLAEKAKSGQLKSEDMQDATFTVSNLGMFGLDSFTAIINSPESGILAVGAAKEKAVVIDKQIVIRTVCNLSLTYDHRIIDGAPAAEFLMLVKAVLENPYRLI